MDIFGLRYNFQTLSTNRYIVDSPRAWRKEFHPRFKDIFSYSDFRITLDQSHANCSFKLTEFYLTQIANQLYNYFKGKRFICIPAKDPNSPEAFLSDLYFVMNDILPAIEFKDFELKSDDFNIVHNEAQSGKVDISKTAIDESGSQNTRKENSLDILSESNLESNETNSTQNVDDENQQNTLSITDVFLSAQNQGVSPTTSNTKFEGVSGVPQTNGADFSTSKTSNNVGDSIKGQTNTSGQSHEGRSRLTQNNDERATVGSYSNLGNNQSAENSNESNSDYRESLEFNRVGRLQEFHNLVNTRHWKEILSRLNKWVLQIDIATSERSYNECLYYD